MLRTASLLPLLQGFRHWASTPDVSLRRCQSATGPPDSYPDRTYTGRRRRAYEHEDQLPNFTASPLALLDAPQTQYKINSRRVLGWLHPLKRRAEALAQSRPSAEHPRRLAGPGRNPTAGPSMADPSKGWRRCDQDPVPILASQAECGKTGRGSENDGLGGVGEEGADVG
jgi:hypothetical protein